jgi:hypothetical protein
MFSALNWIIKSKTEREEKVMVTKNLFKERGLRESVTSISPCLLLLIGGLLRQLLQPPVDNSNRSTESGAPWLFLT